MKIVSICIIQTSTATKWEITARLHKESKWKHKFTDKNVFNCKINIILIDTPKDNYALNVACRPCVAVWNVAI